MSDTVRSEKEQLEVAKAAETSSIPPHHSFTICCTPDTVAECWDGVWTEEPKLYEKLWSLEKFYDEPRYTEYVFVDGELSEIIYGEVIPTEHLFPDSLYRLNTVAGFWDKFTDEEKILLNKLAHRERGE
jgi:hypothetical protein